ncbi:hypothetical protein [Paraburkholderia sp. MM6662-R1]|uniref:hypothetical protein n=1 Tax=Paraburkholderia sp. MM6662-R1 TaxID=2991066 RepID=UPI003D1DAB86
MAFVERAENIVLLRVSRWGKMRLAISLGNMATQMQLRRDSSLPVISITPAKLCRQDCLTELGKRNIVNTSLLNIDERLPACQTAYSESVPSGNCLACHSGNETRHSPAIK